MQREIFLSILTAMSCVYILVCKRKIFLNKLMQSAICVQFSHLVDDCVT
jgi:hypothetical protein